MDRKAFAKLIEKYNQGICTSGEKQLLETWYNEYLKQQAGEALPADFETVKGAALDHLTQHLSGTPAIRPARTLQSWLPYAAAAVLFVAAIGFFVWKSNDPAAGREHLSATIGPGTNRAVLTLADGTQINLDSTQTGIVIEGERIVYRDNPSQVITLDASGQLADQLVLTTPNGGTYQLTLPDGSRVWLNAGSTLTYPGRFDEDRRVVELEGEAYFEVASIRRSPTATQTGESANLPFLVRTKGQLLEVLGTQFNVSAYADEYETTTTLVEGKVRLSSADEAAPYRLGPHSVVLNPGEQSTLAASKITKHTVNTLHYTAWKDNLFDFQGKDLDAIMKQIGRWYDVEIVYRKTPPEMRFGGAMGRDLDLGDVVQFLQESGLKVTIDEKNRRLIVG